jgi:hypothetical protein
LYRVPGTTPPTPTTVLTRSVVHVETRLTQHRNPVRRGMRPFLQMSRPLHHCGIADDHRLVRLVDANCPLAQRNTRRPRLNAKRAACRRSRLLREHLQQCLGHPITRYRPSPPPIVVHQGNGSQAITVLDDGQAFTLGEVERVERIRQPKPDA